MSFVGGATQSQRSQELRRFFAPPKDTSPTNNRLNDYIQEDGALVYLAESVAWRLGGKRVMISLIDGDTQYFLAGAELEGQNVDKRVDWFGRSDIPMQESLCQSTTAADEPTSEYPCVVIKDLSSNKKYSQYPVVNGSVATYRFYAGTSIVTDRSVEIGSFFLLDTKPRHEGLNIEQRKVMCTAAARVMKHLEIYREATERRRVTLMSHGIARFLESRPRYCDVIKGSQDPKAKESSNSDHPIEEKVTVSADSGKSERKGAAETENAVRRTLERAASILRESLEIDSGGVMFLDAVVNYSEVGSTGAYSDPSTSIGRKVETADRTDKKPFPGNGNELSHGGRLSTNAGPPPGQTRTSERCSPAAELMAVSTSRNNQPSQHAEKVMDRKSLQTLLNVYPEGNVWYFDEGNYFSSLEQTEQHEARAKSGQSSSDRSYVNRRIPEQNAEATLLKEAFEKARQIIFLPMWDAAMKRWYAGCLVWSHSPVPVFTVDSEIAYLAAFTNSIMIEISRLDALRADRAKADFISSISHEFRSPLHGILASADFLRESTKDETQSELISIVQNCGRTLLETINQVLDFSKINSFQKVGTAGGQGDFWSNELYSETNIAILCEDVLEGMIVANGFHNMSSSDSWNLKPRSVLQTVKASERPVQVIMDVGMQSWNFLTQPGAVRRILMNIFGNAQKYTDKGFIQVRLRTEDAVQGRAKGIKDMSSAKIAVSLTVKDSGRGISEDYLKQKLYTPFAQDDTFAPGVGLGLSIVRKIVEQLEGVIAVRSLRGQGTEVEICFPVEKPEHMHGSQSLRTDVRNPRDANNIIKTLKEIAKKPSVAIHRPLDISADLLDGQNMLLDCVKMYISDWYGFPVSTFHDWGSTPAADVVVVLEAYEPSTTSAIANLASRQVPVLVIKGILPSKRRKSYPIGMAVGHVTHPIGPYKLARHLLSVLQAVRASVSLNAQDPKNSVYTTYEEQRLATKLKESSLMSQQPAAKEPEADLKDKFSSMDFQNRNNTSSLQDATQKPASTDGLRILAVDDNEVNLQLLRRFLSKRKADTVDLARDGLEAVAAVQKAAKPYDIVFMDISMPVMDGFEATREIRQHESEKAATENANENSHPRTYIVALTGLGADRDREEASKCGFDDYMTKPIPFQRVGKLLSERSSG